MNKIDNIKKLFDNVVLNHSCEFIFNNKNFGRGGFEIEWLTMLGINDVDVIFDVGCYDLGDSIRFKNYFKNAKIYSFEASPLRWKFIQDSLKGLDINVYNIAVSNIDGELSFYDSLVDNQRPDAQGSIYRHSDVYKNKHPRIIQQENSKIIPSIRLDTFCNQNNISKIDLAHIDVEGAELLVVDGFGNIRPSVVYVETLNDINLGDMWIDSPTSEQLHEKMLAMNYILVKDFSTDRLYLNSNILY